MKITEVRIFSSESRDGKLKAFATMTFDDWFVVRNVKIIEGSNGLFVAMPSRKVMDPCPKCGFKNARGSNYCNQCGKAQAKNNTDQAASGSDRDPGHMDIAHPVTPECRTYIQKTVLEAYGRETGKNSVSEKDETKGQEAERPEESQQPDDAQDGPADEDSKDPNVFSSEKPSADPSGEGLVEDKNKDIEL